MITKNTAGGRTGGAVLITKAVIARAAPAAKPYDIRGQNGLILRVQPSGYKGWYVTTRRNQRTRIGSAKVITLERAEFLAHEALKAAADPSNPLIQHAPKRTTLAQFVEAEYTPWVSANRRRHKKTLSDLARCFAHLTDRRLMEITRADLDDYVQSRMREGASAATIVRDFNTLRGVLRLAVERGYLRDNVFKGWEKPNVEDAGVTRYLSADEEKRLRAALRKRDGEARRGRARGNKHRAARGYDLLPEIPKDAYSDHLTPMVLLSMNTGLRYGELAGLEWASVDARARNLTVTGRTAKGAKTRHIPLNDEALDVLARWHGSSSEPRKGLVFANADGSRIGSVKTAWAAVLDDAKITDFRWHDLRHSFASKLVQRGVDLVVVRDLLGHGDFALTLRYAHLEPKQKADAVARLNK